MDKSNNTIYYSARSYDYDSPDATKRTFKSDKTNKSIKSPKSVRSLKINQKPSSKLNPGSNTQVQFTFRVFEKFIDKKNNDNNISLSEDEYDSSISNSNDSYNKTYNKDFSKIQLFLKNKDYDKVNDLKNGILMNETNKRKRYFTQKWQKFKLLEEQIINEKYLLESDIDNIDKDSIFLANTLPDDGYKIISKDFLNDNFKNDTFCGFNYYTKK